MNMKERSDEVYEILSDSCVRSPQMNEFLRLMETKNYEKALQIWKKHPQNNIDLDI